MKWILYSDGASRGNPGQAGAGAFIVNGDGVEHPISVYIGKRTNNQAEYEGVIHGLKRLGELGAKDIEIRSDSELMVRQLNGQYRVKNPELLELYLHVRQLMMQFDRVVIEHVPREENKRADQLANEAIDRELGLRNL